MTGRVRWVFGLKVLASLALIVIAVALLDWRRIADAILLLDAGTLAAATAGAFGVLLVLALRWLIMIRRSVDLPAGRHVCQYLFGMLMSSFTPANIGSDIYRFAALNGRGLDRLPLVGLFIQEKLLLLLGYLVLLPALGLALAVLHPELVGSRPEPLFAACAAALAGAILLLLAPRWVRWLVAMLPEEHPLSRTLRRAGELLAFGGAARSAGLLAVTLLSMVVWFGVLRLLADTLGISLPFVALAFAAVVVELVRWLPVTLQGVGLREAAFASLFGYFGHDPVQGFVLGGTAYLALSAAMLLAGLVGALGLLLWRDPPVAADGLAWKASHGA